jgi:hypothetical protein
MEQSKQLTKEMLRALIRDELQTVQSEERPRPAGDELHSRAEHEGHEIKCRHGKNSHTPRPIVEEELQSLLEQGINCAECWKSFLIRINQASRAQKGTLFKKQA